MDELGRELAGAGRVMTNPYEVTIDSRGFRLAMAAKQAAEETRS